jgi:60S ribosomal export protein NMD3
VQCPLCGREVAELLSGLCTQCASERRPFLHAPEYVDVTRCAHCGRLEKRGTFVPAPSDNEGLVRAAIPNDVDVDPDVAGAQLDVVLDWEDERNAMARLRLTGSFHGHPVAREGESRVRLKQTACPDCSRRYGGYFEAIVQVRAEDERILRLEGDRVLHRINEALEGYREEQRTGAYASKTERVRGGFDLYMGSQEVARLVARELAEVYGADYAESSKLVGRRDGRDLLRFTLRVRLPGYLPGDFVLVDGRPYKILRQEKRMLTLWDLERSDRIQRDPKRAKQIKVIGLAADEQDAIVVSYHDGTLQLLDPVSFKTVDLSVAANDVGRRDTVRVFRYDEHLFVLPATVKA